ncbi:MAG: hypothetical protein IPN34_23995 [Planctomycetes bacterium]|nr:hypothetical protein [Planctomycetota bacterium]
MSARAAIGSALVAAFLALVWLLFLAPEAYEEPRVHELGAASAGSEGISEAHGSREFAARRRDEGLGGGAAVLAGDLHVLCLAPDGTPVPGLEVELRTLDRSGERPLETFFSQRADASGRLCFAGAREVLLREEAPHGWALATSEFRPWVGPRRLDLERDFERVVEWRLPPFGAVEVRVLDPRGLPVADGMLVELSEAGDSQTRALSRETAVGVARFDRLGLAMPFDVRVLAEIGDRRLEQRVEELAFHGEFRKVEVRIGAQETWLSARVLTMDGEPLPSERLRIQLVTAERDTRDVSLKLDREGRLLVSVENMERDAPRQLLLRRLEQAQSLLFDLPEIARGTSNELGDLRLCQDVLIASGQVLDAAGHGASSAMVEAMPLDVSPPASLHPLRERQAPRAACLEDGRFEIREPDLRDAVPTRYLLCARESGGLRCSVPLEVSRGATSVDLHLVAAGAASAQLLLPEGLPRDAFTVVLVDGRGVPFPTISFARGSENWLEAEQLPPDSYALQLRLSAWRESISVLTGLVVPSGEACSDRRLRPLDLRPYLQVIELEIERTDHPTRWIGGRLEIRDRARPQEAPSSVHVPLPRFRIVLPARPFVGTLRFNGCEPAELDLSSPRQRVVLRPR